MQTVICKLGDESSRPSALIIAGACNYLSGVHQEARRAVSNEPSVPFSTSRSRDLWNSSLCVKPSINESWNLGSSQVVFAFVKTKRPKAGNDRYLRKYLGPYRTQPLALESVNGPPKHARIFYILGFEIPSQPLRKLSMGIVFSLLRTLRRCVAVLIRLN